MEKAFTKVWDNCLEMIKDNVSAQSFKTWFEPIKPIKLSNKVLTIQVPSQFFYEWIEEHYISLLKKVIKKELGMEGRLEYSIIMENNYNNIAKPYTVKVPASNKKETKNPVVRTPYNVDQKNIRNPFIFPGIKKMNVESQLNPNYNFDNFVEGDCNRLARSAGYAVGQTPGQGTSFNPLLIYGNVGLGKTHLSHAIGLRIKQHFPNKIVLYVSSEKFAQQYIDAVKDNNINDFVHFYQLIDTLILDDVQFLAG